MQKNTGHRVAIIGAGPAGLMAAETIAARGVAVTVYDAMPSAGRKFLMAGRGGLNLTHSEPLPAFLNRYGRAQSALTPAIEHFSPDAMRDWSAALGQPTFIGSSGRIFPDSFKASPLLRAWLRRLNAAGVTFAMRHRWTGWDADGALQFVTPDGPRAVTFAATVLALGGASWPKLGSDGAWTSILKSNGIAVAPLRPSNCGFGVAWSEHFRERFAGQPLKGIMLSFAGQTMRGEAMPTRDGIEGGAIYALSAHLRDAIDRDGSAVLTIALRPDMSRDDIVAKLNSPRGKQSLSNHLRKSLHLSAVAIGLLQEAAIADGVALASLSPDDLAEKINAVPVRLTGIASIARAISTAGGIAFDELDASFMLRKRPGVFAAGEMLDWDAPTGGYLLQAAFATGRAAGLGALRWIER